VTFDPTLTLINIDGDFKGSGALSSGSLPINIAGSWLNTDTGKIFTVLGGLQGTGLYSLLDKVPVMG
jgi:hypothetical protein